METLDPTLCDEWEALSAADDPSLKSLVITGHFDSFRRNSERGTLLKLTAVQELRVRRTLREANSEVSRFLPTLRRAAELEDGTKVVLEMEDLTHNMAAPCLVDVKMGSRTFCEEEASGEGLREDLLEKMLKQHPDVVSEDERRAGGISKLRYLRFRDEETTTSELGFRVDGLQLAGPSRAPSQDELKGVSTSGQLEEVLRSFFTDSEELALAFAALLADLRKAFEGCPTCTSYAFIRTSLLLVYDQMEGASSARLRLIDLTHVYQARERLDHRTRWRPGSDEDGFLTGLDNMIAMLDRLSRKADR